VISRTNNVYVCLDNNQGKVSTVEPLSETSAPFYTSDGNQWLRLYTVNAFEQLEHSSNNFIPITTTFVNNRDEGAINTVVIDSRGSGYVPSAFNQLYDVNHCYCKILGDGTGAVAKITMSAGRIFEVRVVREGSGYTRARLDFKPFRVYNSLLDLDAGENGFDPRGNGAFKTTVIIPPPGGWGTDVSEDKIYTLARQLGGTRVGIYTRFTGSTEDYIEQGSFRQIGLLDEVEFPGDENPSSASVIKAVKVIEPLNTQDTDFTIGETIYQIHTDELDPSVTYTAKGTVVGWEDKTTILRYIQDAEIHSDLDGNLYEFKSNQEITGETSKKEVIPDVTFGSPEVEELDGLTFDAGYMVKEVEKYSGSMLYLTNLSPITRVTTQSERVSIIISY